MESVSVGYLSVALFMAVAVLLSCVVCKCVVSFFTLFRRANVPSENCPVPHACQLQRYQHCFNLHLLLWTQVLRLFFSIAVTSFYSFVFFFVLCRPPLGPCFARMQQHLSRCARVRLCASPSYVYLYLLCSVLCVSVVFCSLLRSRCYQDITVSQIYIEQMHVSTRRL